MFNHTPTRPNIHLSIRVNTHLFIKYLSKKTVIKNYGIENSFSNDCKQNSSSIL